MNSAPTEPELAEPHLGMVLATAGLDVEYVRAEGNRLYFHGPDGAEVPVIDYAGGYASLIFGHNHPDIVARAKEVLDAQTPVYTQFSRHSAANKVAIRLNEILRREAGVTEPYFATFASTGAEAIESAVKHAEFDRVIKASTLSNEINAHIEHVRGLVNKGEATVPESAYARIGASPQGGGADGFESLAVELLRQNAEQAARPPVFLALEGSFHGKLVGSVQLTHNAGFRAPFATLAAQARFVPFGEPGAVKKIVEEERATLFDVAVNDGAVEVVERDLPVITAFLLEPVQGEGGIRAVGAEFAAEIQEVCAAADVPIVLDEIQTGLGRTGAFLASSHIGLRGDYYVFSKSLGGGLAKSSVMLVREARYRKDFELVHSSTFAKDGFSTAIALKVLDLLEADGGAAYRTVEERGAALRGMLERVRADHPDVVKDVRGTGLLLGFEFVDQSEATAPTIQAIARDGVFGYVLAGFLLRKHGIRALPTASAVNTLRFAPSLHLSDEEIAQLEEGLRAICEILHDQDEQRLMS